MKPILELPDMADDRVGDWFFESIDTVGARFYLVVTLNENGDR